MLREWSGRKSGGRVPDAVRDQSLLCIALWGDKSESLVLCRHLGLLAQSGRIIHPKWKHRTLYPPAVQHWHPEPVYLGHTLAPEPPELSQAGPAAAGVLKVRFLHQDAMEQDQQLWHSSLQHAPCVPKPSSTLEIS